MIGFKELTDGKHWLLTPELIDHKYGRNWYIFN